MAPRVIQMDFYTDWVELLREQLSEMGYHLTKNDQNRIPLMYFNVKGRLIDHRPRIVIAAPRFPWPGEDHPQHKGLAAVLKKIETGEDLTPHLSTAIRKPSYNDMLLNDWGIHHIHLGVAVSDNGFVERTKPLLYVFITDTSCHLITIANHEFSLQSMVETIHVNWPQLISRYRLKCEGVEYSPTDEEIRQLRNGGVSYPIQMADSTVYMSPGGGYASSGVCDKAAMNVLRFQKRLGELEDYVKEKVDAMADFAAAYGHQFGDRLHFKLRFARDDAEVFRVAEATSGVLFQVGD